MKPARVIVVLLCLPLVWPSVVMAQSFSPGAGSAKTASAKDPATLLKAAAPINGLNSPHLKPWHMQATWETLDAKKRVEAQGSWEEWWVGNRKFKIVVSAGSKRETIFGTKAGAYIVRVPASEKGSPPAGGSGAVPAAYFSSAPRSLTEAAFYVTRLLNQPVPEISSTEMAHIRLLQEPLQYGGASLECVLEAFILPGGHLEITVGKDGKFRPALNRYCFNRGVPILRLEAAPDEMTTFNSLVRFQGRYVARAIQSEHSSLGRNMSYGHTTYHYSPVSETKIAVQLVEALKAAPDAIFVPPSKAERMPDSFFTALSAGVVAGRWISGAPPKYSPEARELHLQGTVTIAARILQDGSVADLRVLSGPRALEQAALDGVRTWHYEPFLLGGVPVEVDKRIPVYFSIGF